jgi:RimJ/RimL family protein N-acetyltransferase
MKNFQIRPLKISDREWVTTLLQEQWAGPKIVTRGKIHYADKLPGFVAMLEEKPVGLVTYNIVDKQCEIITMNSLAEKRGIGQALLTAVKNIAVAAFCQRVWLITTNDNIAALRFYQKYGLKLVAVHRNALEESRRIKPEIPLTGNDGIEIRDEIELEMVL